MKKPFKDQTICATCGHRFDEHVFREDVAEIPCAAEVVGYCPCRDFASNEPKEPSREDR